MKRIITLSIIIMVSVLSCRKPFCQDKSDQTSGAVIRHLDNLKVAYDQNIGDLGRDGVRISTSEQYKRVFAYSPNNRIDSVDFTQYEILGLSTINRGSNSSYIRDVKIDSTKNVVAYTVTEEYCIRSSPVYGEGNFVLIKKLPFTYKIEYKVNH